MKKFATLLGGVSMAVAGPAMAADIVIGVPNWPSVNATAHILKVAIEQNLGLEVELQNGTNPIVFEAMDSGAMHVHPEVWMPNQQNLHDTYVTDKGTVAFNANGVEAFQGMCVDKATADANDIRSIDDLTNPDIAALFDSNGDGQGEVWIGAPGWASTNVEKIRAKSYGYDQVMELTEIDETVAYANLDNAIKAGEPWVGFCYTPHYVFALHDMQILEEPAYDASKWNVLQPTDDPEWLEKSEAGVAWDLAYLHLHYAKSLEEEYPEVAQMLANMKLDTDAVSAMTYALVIEGKEPLAYAEEWVATNEDAVLDWMSQ
ncbi:ABC transporter substrate-binding protein [Ruegeria atlantica]|uniref:ABC transporter substrate-binding protein n=1 Tax=Ruegeria atlantica TaxID=81569 RepID=UPI00147A28C9|nr:glycine betaine ABC transporter substrate-binding protein [Ruegeria atlantica]